MALHRRRPSPGLIHNSDQGSQFISLAFGQPDTDPAELYYLPDDFGVPPVSWTLDRWALWPGSEDRCSCLRPRRIPRSSVVRPSRWCGRPRSRSRSLPPSSVSRRRRCATGPRKRSSTRVSAATAWRLTGATSCAGCGARTAGL